ncbi:uncharacterized protein OCT59_004991 [Rhizophagus irregularis]|uniref:uncharacterized protein n=1 Tax=Rhizophagus irregularis TaxID=588596 RepID=UPI00332B0EAB|nr:hypothetical protein OCT59_004991 [Rhizophagus irregularis]
MWTDDEVRMLIDERKEGNDHYHSLGGGVLMELSLSEDPRGKQTRNGERYHVEFRSGFWKKPSKYLILNLQQQDPDQDHKLRSQQQQQQQHQQNSDHPDQDQKLRSLEDQKVVQIFDELL